MIRHCYLSKVIEIVVTRKLKFWHQLKNKDEVIDETKTFNQINKKELNRSNHLVFIYQIFQ